MVLFEGTCALAQTAVPVVGEANEECTLIPLKGYLNKKLLFVKNYRPCACRFPVLNAIGSVVA